MTSNCQRVLTVIALLSVLASASNGQSMIGTWQGTLHAGPRPLRMKLEISQSSDGPATAILWSLDEGNAGGFDPSYRADTVQISRSHLLVTLTPYRVRYVASMPGRSDTIRGTWTEAGKSQPLDLVRATSRTEWRDPSPHRERFVQVEAAVRLETLDWGGSGRAVVLLAGAGNTAHVFDEIAPKLTDRYHVYGITRRGFGTSSAPSWGYLADSLADDVLAALDSLGVERPVLIGHSIAGQELSSIGWRHPERVAGLVYLDAAYPYAYYDSSSSAYVALSIRDVQHKLARLNDPLIRLNAKTRQEVVAGLIDTTLPQLVRDLQTWKQSLAVVADKTAVPQSGPVNPVMRLLDMGAEKYTTIRAPVLAIFAAPHETPAGIKDSVARVRFDSSELARILPQIRAFERGVPSARVVTLPHANHFVFVSNQAEVLREIRGFIDSVAK